MKEQIAGNNYDYIIELEDGEGEYNFEIKSLYKVGGSKSGIVNLNFIISELIEPILNIVPEDTSISIKNKKKAYLLYNTTISYFNDILWIENLEGCLDEDRSFGEWEAEFEFA